MANINMLGHGMLNTGTMGYKDLLIIRAKKIQGKDKVCIQA